MVSEENSSTVKLVQDLSYCVWRTENQVDTPINQHLVTNELPEILKKKLVSQSFDILLKQKNLCLDKNQQNEELSYLLFKHFYKQVKQGRCDAHDKELYNNYVEDLETIVAKYEAANSVFTLIAALSGSKPKRKIKPNEMLNCFYFGSLKHCVPPDQRSQTLQDQFDILHTSDSNTNVSLFTNPSFASHNPFRIPKIFEFRTDPILLHAPTLNINAPRVLNIPDRTTPMNQDEGYFTPDSANILEVGATPCGGETSSQEQSWPQPSPPASYSDVPAWNTLANTKPPREKQFALDFQQGQNSDNAAQHLVQVLQSGAATPSPDRTSLFTHLKSNQVFIRDLKFLLMGIPSRCFPFDKDKKQFICAYGIYTEHISPDFLVNFLQLALQCGNYAHLLRTLDKRHWTMDKKKGYVFLSFFLCIQENLRSYDTQVSLLSPDSQWTYIELQDLIFNLHRRLSTLARLVQQDTTMLLNHIYGQALDSFCTNQNAELNVMVARIFECCTNTYFELLEKWLYRGECHDFLVTQSHCHSLKSRLFWVKGFRFNKVQCPVFLLDHEEQIFACGKNISLLKLTNPEDLLFSVDPSKLPQLKCYLTRQSVEMFHARCKEYEASVLEACGEVPSLAKLLRPREYSQEQLRLWQEQAKVKREAYIQQLQEERMKKREVQAQARRKMLQEIENIEAKKKKAKEDEMAADLKIMEEAKRMDEEYIRMKEQEKLNIEEYYRSLMEMIEKRSEHVKSKTQSLEAMKTILKRKVSKEKPTVEDVTDAKIDTPPEATTSSIDLPSQTSSKASISSMTSVTSTDENCGDEIMSIFTLDIPEPPNVELLIKKIEEEEEAILLTRETQRRLEALKANRLQARTNRSRVLSSEYNLCTGEKTAKQAPMFDLAEKFNENNTTPANDEAKENKARAQGNNMSDCMWNINRTQSEPVVRKDKTHIGNKKEEEKVSGNIVEETLRKDGGSQEEKGAVSEHNSELIESILEARESARRIKEKVLISEFDIALTVPQTKDVPDASTRDGSSCQVPCGTTSEVPSGTTSETHSSTMPEASITGSKQKEVVLRSEKKVLSAHEEMLRNRNKVLSQEYHLKEAPNSDRSDQRTGASQEAKDNKDRSEGGSSMSACMQNQTTQPSIIKAVHHSYPNQLTPKSPGAHPTSLSDICSSENLSSVISNKESTASHSRPTQGSGSDEHRPEPNQSSALNENDPSLTEHEHSSLLENETLETNITSSDLSKPSQCKINPAWSFDSSIGDNHDLDVTLVQKYLDASIRTPLYVQYRLTNDAILRLFLNKHHLASHLITLRNYFFLLDGSFAKSLTRDLSEQIRTDLLLMLNPFKLNSILRKAVDYGTCDTRMGQNLTFVMKNNNMDTIENLQESNVFQFISLSYKVEWPVNIVLTPDALTNYDKVFVFLMQVQQVSYTLQQVFVYLKLRRRLEVDNLYIFRQINLFRHVMMQVLSAVQSYIHCSVLELPWHDMVEAFKKPVTLDSVYYRHVEYVKQIIFRCLLNKRSRSLTEALNAMFKNILEFYEELKRRPLEKNYDNLLAIFQKFLKISLYFHDYCRRMVTVGYQEQNLDYLLHMLSLNDYFSKSIPSR
uniref:Gamma-tubulin complex component 6 n=1 Tax=Cacopsylla melanoneura TaxID=428564 RepID=A0A8D9AFJ6_9HEMI